MAQRVMTGSRAELMLNGKQMGLATGVTIIENFQQERIRPIGSIRTVEFATIDYTVQFRAQLYRVPNEDIVNAGLWPQQGRTPAEQLRLVLDFALMTADVYDGYSDAFIGKVTGIIPTTRNVAIQNRGIVLHDLSFEAIAFGDEGSSNF